MNPSRPRLFWLPQLRYFQQKMYYWFKKMKERNVSECLQPINMLIFKLPPPLKKRVKMFP